MHLSLRCSFAFCGNIKHMGLTLREFSLYTPSSLKCTLRSSQAHSYFIATELTPSLHGVERKNWNFMPL